MSIKNLSIANIPDTTLPLDSVDPTVQIRQQGSGAAFLYAQKLLLADASIVQAPKPHPMTQEEAQAFQAACIAALADVAANDPSAKAYRLRAFGMTQAA